MCPFSCTRVLFFWKDNIEIKIQSMYPKMCVLTEMPTPNIKIELQSFLGIMNYQSKFTPSTTEVFQIITKTNINEV